jgi:hypothetical protein
MATGVVRELEIDCTLEQYSKWQAGAMIQDAMPHLSADDREFVMTGITPEEWDSMFSEMEGGVR